MSTVTGPRSSEIVRESSGGVTLPPSPEKIQEKFDLAIALVLATWPALTVAVQNSWGGPDSSEKRDWFAGAVSDLIAANPQADVEYVEEFLLQVMNDEFEVNVEDGSGEEIAAKIVGLRKLTLQGDFGKVDDMYATWSQRNRKGHGPQHVLHFTRGEDQEDTDWDSDDSEEGEDEDATVGEAPALVRVPKERVEPKVDQDGFTEVINRKRR